MSQGFFMQKDNFFIVGYGYRLKHERTRLNFTQEEMAEKCGISRVQWGKYEREIVTPSKKVLTKLEDLGVDIAYLVSAKSSRQNFDYGDYSFSGDYNQLQGSEKKLFAIAHASEWVDEAEEQNAPVKLHPALKEKIRTSASMHGLSRAGVFNLIDLISAIVKHGEHLAIDSSISNSFNK